MEPVIEIMCHVEKSKAEIKERLLLSWTVIDISATCSKLPAVRRPFIYIYIYSSSRQMTLKDDCYVFLIKSQFIDMEEKGYSNSINWSNNDCVP